jgi:ABC-type branched-subunit amino acid transport system ATPase component
LLRVSGLTAGYTQLPVIEEVSIACDPGSIVAILGPNGSGKSTLLKAIVGLLKPMSGHVQIGDTDITGWASFRIVRSGLSYVPQLNNVFVSLSVVENLEMGGFSYGGDIRERVRQVLGAFPDLAAAPRRKAGQLSGGQRNLLGVARALMMEPKVILVDEPTAGLAPVNAKRIWGQLMRIAESGTAVVVAEQNVDAAMKHADRAYVLATGRTRLEGATSDIDNQDLQAVFLGQELTGAGLGSRPTASQPRA